MDFRILGPLEVFAAGHPLPLRGRKQRTVLALLLLSPNEVVPRERLVDAIWGEKPPAEIDASLRVYVARLRKLLSENGSPSTLETRPNGYLLRIQPEALDLNRFRRLAASGEEALTAGRPEDAADALAEALDLWRGPALADLAEDEWARRESVLLDELRLRALEERLEADLAVGRHAEVVPELEALVADQPYRERLVAHLMLALYRSGRQPDALQAYSRVGRALREEFGLEPTRALRELERQILSQDPALDLRPDPAVATAPRHGRLRTVVVTAAVAGLALVAATLLSTAFDRVSPSSAPVSLNGNSLVAVDPAAGTVTAEVPLGGRPGGVALGEGSAWVGNRDAETLLRIDLRTRRITRTIGLGAQPSDVAVGGGSVWVVSEAANAVLQIDPSVNSVVGRVPLAEPRALCGAPQVVFARGAVWAVSPGTLTRIDPRTLVRTRTHVRQVYALAAGGQALWGVTGIEGDRIERLAPPAAANRLDRVGKTRGLVGLASGGQGLWTTSPDGTLAKVDPELGRVTASVPLAGRVAGFTATDRAVWVVLQNGDLVRVDTATGRVAMSVALGIVPPQGMPMIAAGGGAVWIATNETLT